MLEQQQQQQASASLHVVNEHAEFAPAGAAGLARAAAPANELELGIEPLFGLMLDEIDHGVILLDNRLRVRHANHVAQRQLEAGHPLRLNGALLQARDPAEAPAWHEALVAAAAKGLRRMVMLGQGEHAVSAAVIPLAGAPGAPDASHQGLMVVLGKRQLCGELAVQWYASLHGLTAAETRVLTALCRGDRPGDIANELGVSLHTIRSQISSVRAKAGAESVCELLRQLALLPPLVSAIRCGASAGQGRAPAAGPPCREALAFGDAPRVVGGHALLV
jgi:DNA-binding CsgD family transcriptional regulator